MDFIISLFIWGALSVIVMIAMSRLSNKRAEEVLKQDAEMREKYCAYEKNKKYFSIFSIITAVSILSGYLTLKITTSPMQYGALCCCYLGILASAVIDYKLHIIPNFIPLSLMGFRVVMLLVEWISDSFVFSNLINSVIACILCGLFLTIVDKLSKGGMGKGDIKLLSAIGFLGGLYTVCATLLCALLCCSVIAVVLVLCKKAVWKDSLPFGPFIYLGFVCVLVTSSF